MTKNYLVVKKENIKFKIYTKEEFFRRKKKYWLPNELWEIVKEYAGIYHITTKWDKIMNVGVDRLHDYYKTNFNRRITNIHYNPKKCKKMILKSIIELGMNKDKYEKLAELFIRKNPEGGKIDLTKYKVGEEVIYTKHTGSWTSRKYAGIITKVNKTSITFKPYTISHSESDNPNAFYQQGYENKKHYYDKNNFEKPMCVRSNFYTKNTLEDKGKEYKFDYYELYIDWGR